MVDKVYDDVIPVRAPAPAEITLGYLQTWGTFYTADRPHLGTDWGVPEGTPLRAMWRNRTLVHAVHRVDASNRPLDGWGDGSFGNCTVFDIQGLPESPADRSTRFYGLYAHQSRIDVTPGQDVTGQITGLSGATGTVDGAHVHVQLSTDPNFSRASETRDPLLGWLTLASPPPGLTNEDLAASLNHLNDVVIGLRDGTIAANSSALIELQSQFAALAAESKRRDDGIQTQLTGIMNFLQKVAATISTEIPKG